MAEEGEGYRLIQNSDSISEGPLRVVFLFASSCPLLAQSRHGRVRCTRPLSEAKQTSARHEATALP
jgi:hypothetical protein